VSVLFCDLVGFTAASAGRDAEETRELLAAYYDLARERVERYGGTIEKFIGDAVMAVWGVPIAHEDDAERAVRAALDLVAAVPGLAAGATEQAPGATAPAGLAARVAVMTGEVAVTLGAEGQGMVAGDLVNTASRLQSVAQPGSVLVGEATREATARSVAYEPAGEPELRGKALPVPAWRALRAVAMVGGRFASDEIEPPFVGRDGELRFLTEMYHASARERRLRLVSVTGQAGIGKSRLARELERYLDGIAETVHWHRGRCPSYGEGLTFWAVGEMVRRRAGIAEGDDAATTAEHLRGMLAEFVADPAERGRLEPPLRALLGLDTLGWSVTETGELYVAWRTLFERIAEQGPVVLVFEDLQWADDGLVGFIQHLLEWSRTQPILVVTLARPEFLDVHPTWGAGLRNFASLHLEPLPERAVIELLEGVIPGLPSSATRAIARRAEGVPLYAVETIRMLLAQGVLARDEQGVRVSGDLGAVAIPDSLRGLVAARLDTLPAEQRSLLQQASVLGQSFAPETLAAVTRSSPEDVEPVLRELAHRELLREETDPRSPERGQYLWVQSVIREVAYSTLARRERRALHLAAARHFETLGDEEVAGVLADHYLEAWRASGGPEAEALAGQARVALRAASERAERLRNWRQAASFVARALDVTQDPADRATLLERAGDLLARGGAPRDAEARYREALAALAADADPDAVARLVAKVASQVMHDLRIAEALELVERAVAELGPELHGPGRVTLEAQRGRALFLAEDPRADEVLERTIAAAERNGPIDALVEAIVSLGSVGIGEGLLSRAAMLFGSVELARRHGLAYVEMRALNNIGAWASEADPALAREVTERVLELCDRIGYDATGWLIERITDDVVWRDGLDAAERLADELGERVQPGGRDAHELLMQRASLRALRGDAEGFDAVRAQLASQAERSPETVAWSLWHTALGLAVLDRVDEAASAVAGATDRRTASARVLVGLLRRDRHAIERGLEELGEPSLAMGPLRRGARLVGEAGIALMDRVADAAVARALEGVSLLRESLLPEAWCVGAASVVGLVGTGRREVAALEATVRAELERIGAHGALAMLERAVASAPAAAPADAPASRPGARATTGT
jgi:class 3 adenylate cyclase